VTGAEPLHGEFPGKLDDLLNAELGFRVAQPRHDIQKIALPVGHPRPPARKETAVQLGRDLLDRDARVARPGGDLRHENVEGLMADELDEVRVSGRVLLDLADGLLGEGGRAVTVLDRLHDRLTNIGWIQAIEKKHAEHSLRVGPGFDQLGEERGQTGQHQEKWSTLSLDGLEHVEHDRERVFVLSGVVRHVLGLVVGEDDSPGLVSCHT